MTLDDLDLGGLPDQGPPPLPKGVSDADYTRIRGQVKQYEPIIDFWVQKYGADLPDLPNLARAAVMQESRGHNGQVSSAGARGIMQVIDDTYRDMGGDPANAQDPVDNIHRGVKYLALQLRNYKNPQKALAAYNAGPAAVDKYGGIPPYAETQAYVPAVEAYRYRINREAAENPLAGLPDSGPSTSAQGPANTAFASLDGLLGGLPDKGATITPAERFPTAPAANVDPLEPMPIPGVPGMGGENIKGPTVAPPFAPGMSRFTTGEDTGKNLPWDPKQIAEEKRATAINEAKGLEYKQAREGADWPALMGFTATGAPQNNDKQADLTPEAYQRRKMGAGTTPIQVAGDLEKMASEYTTGILANILSEKSQMEAAGERMAQTEATITHKRYIESPEYKNLVDVAKVKQRKGDSLTPEEERALIADPGFWKQVGVAVKDMALNPKEMGIQMLRDYPMMMITGAGIGEFMNVAKGVRTAKAVKAAAEANKYARTALPKAGKVFDEAVQNIGGTAAMNYPQAKAAGEDYGIKEGLRDVVAGGAITGAHMLGGKGVEALTGAEIEGQGGIKLTPEKQALREANNAISLLAARDAAVKAGLAPEEVEHFLASHKHNLDRLSNGITDQLEIKAEHLPAEEPQDVASALDLSSKNSSSSSLQPSTASTTNGGGTTPGTPDAMASDPSLRTNTWTGNDPTRQNVDGSDVNTQSGANSAMPENVTPAPVEVKPREFTPVKEPPKTPEKMPTLGEKVRSMLGDKKIYLSEDTRNQLGTKVTRLREYGPIFTNDKTTGITFDGLAESIREQAENANEHYAGIGHGREVQANDVIDALFAGNQEYSKPVSKEPDHVVGTEEILRNGSDQFDGMTPQPARTLGNTFEAGGMMFKRIGTKDKSRIAYKDEYGGKYEFKPDDVVHTGGTMKPTEAPKEPATATTPEENEIYFQKGPPKASQEDMFGNKGRTASEGFIKGKGEDKGLEGTPLFEGEKRQEQAKAEEGQQRLFDPEDPANREQDPTRAPAEENRPEPVNEEDESFHVESPERVHVASNLRRVAREVQEGRITPDEARQQIESLATKLDENRSTREVIRGMTDRARGPDYIREKLLNARRHGHLSEEGYQLTNWFVEQNPHLVEDLGISIRSSNMPGTAGHYMPFERVVTLMKGAGNTHTGVHEILHHTERMMTPEVRRGILKEYAKQFGREFAGADWKKLQALELISRAMGGDPRAQRELMKKFQDHEIPYSMYQLSNPSEFWAINGSRIMADRHAAEGWVGKARQWLKEFIQHAKGVLGLKNDSAVIRGLRDVLRSDGRYQSTQQLHETRGMKLMDVAKEAPEKPLLQEKDDDKPKGSYHYDKELKKHVITLFIGRADISTLFHEYFHYLEKGGVINAADRTLLAKALKAAGYDDSQEADGRFKKDAAEKLARWYERYLRDGKVRSEAMGATFGKIADMMREIYPSVRTGPLKDEILPHIRDAFDRVQNQEGDAAGLPGKEGALHQKGPEPLPLDEEFLPGSDEDLEKGISRYAKPGEKESGYLTKYEAWHTAYTNRGLPIEKIQSEFLRAHGIDESTLQDGRNIKILMQRVFGAGGSAELHMDKTLKPIFAGGKIDGVEFPKLSHDEQGMVDRYALARDADWRYNHVKGYDFNENFSRNAVNTELRKFRELLKSDPEAAARIKNAADAMVEYGKDLGIKKMQAGIWSEEDFKKYTQNPHYIPEVRDWSHLATPKDVTKKRQFTSTSDLSRGTHATNEGVKVFDPMTALIHDTRELASEAAKMGVWKQVIEMVNKTPHLKGWIKKAEPGQEPLAHEGKISILGTRNTHLTEAQRAMADRYQSALYELDRQKDDRRKTEDDYLVNLERRKTMERLRKLPPDRRDQLGQDMTKIHADLEKARQAYKEKKAKKANAAIDEYRALPEADRNLIEDYLDEGKPVVYIAPRELAEAVNGMNPMEMGRYKKTALAVAGFFRKAAVTWNPAFTVSNFARDLQEAYFNTKMNPIWAFKSFMHAAKKDKVFEDWVNAGGSMSGDESGLRQSALTSEKMRYPGRYDKLKDPGAKTRAFGREIKLEGLNRLAYRIAKGAKAPFDFFAATAEVGELMTRLGVFKYGMKELGLTAEQAAKLSRESTIDFNRVGAKIQNLNSMIPFLNARIQGLDRIRRTWKQDKPAAMVRAFTAAGIPALVSLAWNVQNPNYADIPSWEKEYYWILMTSKTGTGYIKIAKGTVAQFLVNPLQMIWESHIGTASKDYWSIAASVLKAGMPIDDPTGVLDPLTKTIGEEVINKNMYFGKDIVRDKARNMEDQWDSQTSEFLKVLGHRIKLSPERMQHVIQSIAAGTGTNALYLADALTGVAKGLKNGDIKGGVENALKGRAIPVISKVFDMTHDYKSDMESQERQLRKDLEDTKKSMMSKGEFVAGSLRGVPSDTSDVHGRIHRSGDKLKSIAEDLNKVSRGIMAVDSLNRAIETNLPGLKQHWFHRPSIPPKAVTLPTPPAPSDTIPEDDL